MSFNIPENHPRYQSLLQRETLIEAMEAGITAPAGLVAQGRGEAMDYFIGEKTQPFALRAIRAAALMISLAEKPIISVNGNIAALCPGDLVNFSKAGGGVLEINLFYRTPGREEKIEAVLKKHGAEIILGVGEDASASIPELLSERRRVSEQGILISDCVFVPLEDGDRTEALVAMGKSVVTVDLNPLSRTAQKATVTIVDNITRVMPLLVQELSSVQLLKPELRRAELNTYNNSCVLSESLDFIAGRLKHLADAARGMQR